MKEHFCFANSSAFKATLCVTKRDVRQGADKEIETPPSTGAKPRAVVDMTTDSSGANGEGGVVERIEEARHLARIDGEIGIGKDNARRGCGLDPCSHGGTLALIGRLSNDDAMGEVGGDVLGNLRGVVAAAIVDENDLRPSEIKTSLVSCALNAIKSFDKATRLVKRGNDD